MHGKTRKLYDRMQHTRRRFREASVMKGIRREYDMWEKVCKERLGAYGRKDLFYTTEFMVRK